MVGVSHRPLLISMLSRAISLLYPVPISPRNINCTNLVLVFASKSNFARCHRFSWFPDFLQRCTGFNGGSSKKTLKLPI